MLRIVVSQRFKRNLFNFLRKHPELKMVVKEKFGLLQQNPKDRRLRTHKLTGKLKDYFSASITYEYRIIFDLEKDAIFLLAIGTHDEVY